MSTTWAHTPAPAPGGTDRSTAPAAEASAEARVYPLVTRQDLDVTHTHSHTHILLSASLLPDVDECVEEPEFCSPHGECLNTEGSYLCVCESGFTASLDTPSCDGKIHCKGEKHTHTPVMGFHLLNLLLNGRPCGWRDTLSAPRATLEIVTAAFEEMSSKQEPIHF